MNESTFSGEIVGLRKGSNGRSCGMHAVCGDSLCVNDLIKFKKVVVEVEGKCIHAVCVKVIKDATECCIVGFIPQVEVAARGDFLNNKYAQVVEFYNNLQDNDIVRRERDHRYCGVASYLLLESISNEAT